MEENEKNHREMWGILSITGSNYKMEAYHFIEKDPGVNYGNHCFACKEAGTNDMGYTNCQQCPIDWGVPATAKGYMCEESTKSPYYLWLNANSMEERKLFAKVISQLPWGPDLKTKLAAQKEMEEKAAIAALQTFKIKTGNILFKIKDVITENPNTIEEVMALKRQIMYLAADFFKSGHDGCPHCQLAKIVQGTSYFDCNECEYGKQKGKCCDEDSAYQKLREAAKKLLVCVDDY
jgi:hypothetical protein